MPDAAIFAIKTLSERFPSAKIILIAGGQDKNLNYNKLAKEIKKNVKYLIIFSGNASAKIKKEIRNLKISKKTFSIFPNINSMEKAVKLASQLANRGDIVLLSPAAASFNLFKNEFDRGEQFNKFVKKLKRN